MPTIKSRVRGYGAVVHILSVLFLSMQIYSQIVCIFKFGQKFKMVNKKAVREVKE